MFSTQHHTQNSTYKPLTYENLQTHNTSTSHNQTMLTYTILTHAMTLYLPKQTRTWDGLLFPPLGLTTNTPDILQILLPTDESTIST